jgi:hypothetical protein
MTTRRETFHREPERARVEAWRDHAAVILDALILDRRDVATRTELDRLMPIAFMKYRLDRPGVLTRKRPSGMLERTHWNSTHRRVERRMICLFCGECFATLPQDWWRTAREVDRADLDRHVYICALTYVAGLRELSPLKEVA